jgi:hypothetical protein
VAVRSKTNICSLSIVGIAGSNPAECMDVLLFCLLFVAKVAASATSSEPAECLCVCLCVRACVCARRSGNFNTEAVKARIRPLPYRENKNV